MDYTLVMQWGSPPHTRGKSALDASDKIHNGITPAYAGKMPLVSRDLVALEDHPRIRGEN